MMNWSEYEEEQSQRKTISPYWLLILAILLPLVLTGALWAGKVYGAMPTMVARDTQGNWIRLTDEPCPAAKEWLKLRKAEMFYQGKNYSACWRSEGGGVLIFDDNGDFSLVPVQAFERDIGA